jgi:predicted transcriptional regulator
MRPQAVEKRTTIGIVADYKMSGEVPIDVEGLARELGLTVDRVPMLRDIAGKIKKDRHLPGAGYRVVINANDNRRRQRFTLAHEIAHYVMHVDLIGDGVTDDAMYRSTLSGHYERQANKFAADLLLPPSLVRQEWRSGNRSIAGIAAIFDVSEQAVRIRLEELGYGA